MALSLVPGLLEDERYCGAEPEAKPLTFTYHTFGLLPFIKVTEDTLHVFTLSCITNKWECLGRYSVRAKVHMINSSSYCEQELIGF